MFFAYKKLLGRTEMRTRYRLYCQTIRTVRDISRDDRARIATSSLRTLTDRLKENYSIDGHNPRYEQVQIGGERQEKMEEDVTEWLTGILGGRGRRRKAVIKLYTTTMRR